MADDDIDRLIAEAEAINRAAAAERDAAALPDAPDGPVAAANGAGRHDPELEAPGDVVRPFLRLPLDLRNPPPAPAQLTRLLYAGLLTVVQSEPGVGKSWLATWQAAVVLEAGFTVVYIDEEGGPDLLTERLVMLGVDPDVVNARLFYYAFEARAWIDEDLAALDAVIAEASTVAPLGLGVLDSLPDFLAAAGMSEDSSMDVTRFVLRVCSRFRAAEAGCLLLDHLPKPATDGTVKRSRYGRGTGAKLAKADATLLVEAPIPFDVRTSGQLRLWKTKDRRGRLDLPDIRKPNDPPYLLNVVVGDGRLEIKEGDPVAPRNTYSEAQQAVLDVLIDRPGEELSQTRLGAALKAEGKGFRRDTVAAAVELLHHTGAIRAVTGRRDSLLVSWPPEGMSQGEIDRLIAGRAARTATFGQRADRWHETDNVESDGDGLGELPDPEEW